MHTKDGVCRALIASAAVATAVAVLAGGPAAGAQAVPVVRTRTAPTANEAHQLAGYWVVDQAGGVGSGGGAPQLGELGASVKLSGPVVAMAATPDGRGYWLASAGGRVFDFGDAGAYGRPSPVNVHRSGDLVGMASTSDGRGYWLVSASGKVFAFGDAKPYGSVSRAQLLKVDDPVVGMAAAPEGGGYWLVASNGRVFCFGDAACFGRPEGLGLAVVGLAPTPSGQGYWLATTTGRVLAFGSARPQGVAPLKAGKFVGIAATRGGHGYWLANSSGSTFGYGLAAPTRAAHLADGAVAIVPDPAVVAPAPPVPATSGAAVSEGVPAATVTPGRLAVQFAMAQVGKPYVYGATGPGGYDCSGLALASWRVAGLGLPRTAAEQYWAGAHVPLSQLQPGDLIFWAHDPGDPATIFHVAISLGGDETVQATHTGSTVQVLEIWGPDLVPLATRP
jgi:cell wall-associated NlpC family hydrolase